MLLHTGGVHRWAAAYVTAARPEEFDAAVEERFFAHVDDDTLVDWFRSGHRALVEALAGADPAVRCWSFLPALRRRR